MFTIERGKLDGAIRVKLMLGIVPVVGLTAGDITIAYHLPDGTFDSMDGFSLAEVDPTLWPGVYLITEYPEAFTSLEGPVAIKVQGADIDDNEEVGEISATREQVRKLYELSYLNLIWNVDESRWDLKNESDVLLGWFPGLDVNGNPAIIDGTHPVSRAVFVPAP
jgi:hypothetical protein